MKDVKPTKKPTEKAILGAFGETIAGEFLKRKGYAVIECNYRKPWGEVDIICEKDGVVHFVEVKTVSREINASDGSRETMDHRPEEQIHSQKLKRIVRTAELYMSNHKDNREFQIDAVGIILDQTKRIARCRFFEQIL